MSARRTRATLFAALGALALGLVLALALGAFRGASSQRPRISAREARALSEGGSPPTAPHGRPAIVAVGEATERRPVAGGFIGLSFETTAIPLLAKYASGGNLAGYLRSLGPGVIRIGGVSLDQRAAFSPRTSARPAWASVAVTPSELAGIAALARETGWRVLLSVNLGHYEPAAAAQEAASAHALLGPLLAGIAIGNEPDRYARERLRSSSWGSTEYLNELGAYRRAIERAAPGVPIVAPDASSGIPPLPWLSAAASARPAALADHYYPLSSCGGVSPVLSELTSPITRAHEQEMLGRLQAIQHATGIPLLIDETGSISCHGQPGVSNSFASALWALDWELRAMRAGIAGLDFHDLVTERGAYSPLVFVPGAATASHGAPLPTELRANPDWYALLLAAPLAGSTPVPVSASGDPGLAVGAFMSTVGGRAGAANHRRLRVVLVDFDAPSAQPLLVRLHLPAGFTSGSILRLIAPSPDSTSRVQLGGAEVASSGSFTPRRPLPRLYRSGRALSLELPASSAALVTLDAPPSH